MPTRSFVNRRSFLGIGSAGLLGLGLPELLRAEALRGETKKKATGAILVWLGGGAAAVGRWGPKPRARGGLTTSERWARRPSAPGEIRGDSKPIATKAAGVMICKHLPKVAGFMDRCALVRSLHHSIVDHGAGATYMAPGPPPAAALKY